MEDNLHVHVVHIDIPFATARLAQIAYDVLRVDVEPKRGGVQKQLFVQDNILHVKYTAELARQLRVAVNSFFENLILINKTLDCFGDYISESYSYFL